MYPYIHGRFVHLNEHPYVPKSGRGMVVVGGTYVPPLQCTTWPSFRGRIWLKTTGQDTVAQREKQAVRAQSPGRQPKVAKGDQVPQPT